MIRSVFFSVGLFVGLCGVGLLYADKVVLKDDGEKRERDSEIRGMLSNQQIDKDVRRVFDPPEWAAFTMMSIGAVTVMYSLSFSHRDYHH